jgi:hypothetical protein
MNVHLAHDAGGKSRLPMLDGVVGDAEFSECGRYRLWLSRAWEEPPDAPYSYALWIGMNPSVAEADVDDPTIRREIAFTKAMGISGYVKCNVMDYRATDPKVLLSVTPRSDDNLRCIFEHAEYAARVILAYGALPKKLRRYADDVIAVLQRKNVPLWCMGKTANGSPRHPLYLPGTAQPEPWP